MELLAQMTDAELLAEMKGSNQAAFTELHRRYHALLYIYAYKLTGEEQDSKDLVQEIFISLWNKRETTDLQSSLRSYLYCGVRYKFLKSLAHRKVRSEYAERFQELLEEGVVYADEALLLKELVFQVEKMTDLLPGKMGQVFRMSKLEQYSNEEIADTLQISEKTVKNLLSEANKNIRFKKRFQHYLFWLPFLSL